ncbi:transcriptional regulator [Heyndrickxia vini]|uniref:Transcriptional regulator n=1 Tax=Heyndrickxia vini TaxID=1476025 RepID=A0ABX7E4Y7_9BACI|nr:transcriptional regulator [Heyndrickxia vini]QQZ10532.1 transcriptional regulator [Heyndrickxia vini]
MSQFEDKFTKWHQDNISNEKNHRRREILQKGLGHGTIEFLRSVWFPAVGNFDHLYPEWEVRDFNNGYRYLDLAYMPGEAKGGIEIQGYGPHARDLDVRRFKDLCWRHSLLALDGWTFLPIAYLSIRDEPKRCQQLILSFIGKFISTDVPSQLSWLEAEAVRFARRMLRPVTPIEFANHLRISDRHTRRILYKLVDLQILAIAGGKQRARSYKLVFSPQKLPQY